MNVLFRNANIVDEGSPLNGQQADIAVVEGKITTVTDGFKFQQEHELDGKIITPGLFDLWSDFCDPGYEHKEDIVSGCEAALHGGFTDVCLVPDTSPIIDNKSQVSYLIKSSASHAVDVHPLAAVNQSANDGVVISEMRDLYENGAVGFTGGHHSITNTELLLKALQYSSSFHSVVINRPVDADLTRFGQMHEGLMSTNLGMKGMPSVSEKLIIQRDIELLQYAGGRLHFTGVSSSCAIEEIRKAKSKGLAVTCDVPIFNLLLTDELLSGFDSNLKLDPPLRSIEDQEALITGLNDGTIDAITSYHRPQDIESKELEFDLASFGMVSLQTYFPLLVELRDKVPLSVLLHKSGNGARNVLGKSACSIKEGADARFVVFDDAKEWVYDSSSNYSKSRNSIYFERKMKGLAEMVQIGESTTTLNGINA